MKTSNTLFGKQWIDIVFEKRNTEYGAYVLRQNNEKNHAIAMFTVLAAFLIVFSSFRLQQYLFPVNALLPEEIVTTLSDVVVPAPDVPKPKPAQSGTPPASADPEMRISATADDPLEKDSTEEEDLIVFNDANTATTIPGAGGNSNEESLIPPSAVVVEKQPDIIDVAEIMPSYNGGEEALFGDIQSNLIYPDYERENAIEGRAIISFVVNKKGEITDVKTLKSDTKGFSRASEEAIIKLSDFNPGMQNGKPVNVRLTIPIKFRMQR